MYVTAVNAISNATSPTVEIHVIASIAGLLIVLNNEEIFHTHTPLHFKHFVYIGTDLSLTWTFGDGSQSVECNYLEEVNHTFTR